MSSQSAQYYREIIDIYLPRLLSLMDRNVTSPSYGSFDRDYWHYKIVKDFPSAIYQQGALALACLYVNNFEGNRYYRNSRIKEFALAGVDYWSRLQKPDGSFSEWFPGERSFVATAFTTYAASQVLIILKDNVEEEKKQIFLKSFKQAGRWLSLQKEDFAANHTAGALAALYNIYLLTGDDFFKKAAERKKEELTKFQDEEGWFREYSGCDIGYLSVTVDYLAKYYSSSGDRQALEMAKKALDFMKHFIHPDGSLGGEYSSRNTFYIMMHGIEILKSDSRAAMQIASSLKLEKFPQPGTVDDRYFVFFILPNFIQAMGENKNTRQETLCPETFCRYFKNAAFLSIREAHYSLIVGAKKGGVIKLFRNRDGLDVSFDDLGYFIKDVKGNTFTTQWLNNASRISFQDRPDVKYIVIETKFRRAKDIQSSTIKFFLLRCYAILFGRNPYMAKILDRWLKKFLIIHRKAMSLSLRRKIEIRSDKVIVYDRIYGSVASKVARLFNSGSFVDGNFPTSRFYVPDDITKEDRELPEVVINLHKKNFAELQREIKI